MAERILESGLRERESRQLSPDTMDLTSGVRDTLASDWSEPHNPGL